MERTRRIGILTGGGDVPGLNSVIKSVVYRSTELGYEVVGIRRGWEGLTHMRQGADLDPEYLRLLDRVNTRTIDRTGGTVLHTSRTNPRKMRSKGLPPFLAPERAATYRTAEDLYDLTPLVLDNIEHLGLDYLVTIGGDDTLSFSRVLADKGVPLIAIPKTMDNDVQGTEYCIGFSSAITRAKELINRQRTTLGSHERIGDLPDLRARRGLHGPLHGLRHVGALPHPGVPVRAGAPVRPADRGQAQQPEPLRIRHRRRGRDLEGRLDRRVRARPTRSGIATRRTSPRWWPAR